MHEVWDNKEILINADSKFRTPFYFYDASIFVNTFKLLKAILPSAVDIFYSIKVNPNIAICQEVRRIGACAELCSYYEILAALKAGFDPKNIIFVRPAKSDA